MSERNSPVPDPVFRTLSSGEPRAALPRLRARQRGISTVEYVIILVLLACVGIVSWKAFGQKVKCALGMANDQMVLLEDGTPSGSPCPNTGGGGDSDPGGSDGPSPGPAPSPASRPKRKVVD